MSKSNKYGYSGVDIPTQAFKSNVGKFDPAEINELVADNKWTQFGQLELIETQNISSAVATVDFTDIKENIYNLHFMTWNNMEIQSNNNYIGGRCSSDNGASYESSNYQGAIKYYGIAGIYGELKGNSNSRFEFFGWGDIGDTISGYCFFYNLGDSNKYSYVTQHNSPNVEGGATGFMYLGSAVYTVQSQISGIRLFNYNTSGNFANKGNVSLYGIRYS